MTDAGAPAACGWPALLDRPALVAYLGWRTWRQLRDVLRRDLYPAGFPPPDPLLGRWHRAAVDDWLDGRRRSGQDGAPSDDAGAANDDAPDPIMGAIDEWRQTAGA